MSQPNVWGKNRIRVTQDLYTTLFEFYHTSVMTETNNEAALVFDELRKEEAFLFVAEEHMDTEVYQSKIEFNKAIRMNQELRELKLKKILHDPLTLCSNLKEYEAISVEYQTAKQKIFYTPQAALATQRTLKENLSVTEKRPRLLQNVFLSSTLAQDETNTLKQIKKSSQQILNSKRRKLEQ
ncbi:uncharacterized protein B0P05DRAFT_553442 [Gilbertella persicaria]|uniref:uncharacterized protein n=1 Tax=Gilbertella persicaria TaxID=101096 RepID=UPI0022201ACF|nr:uncharacterized protein B0P05DRAFT_553442 [Gilbertella persicaria]KAI8066219.1 hypothetical protein B0P05DRAFT_553442 [Gilbertella persicaria]